MLHTCNMTQFVNNNVSPGDIVRADDHNTQGARVASVINGNIDNDNIKSSAGIEGAKLANNSITTSKLANDAVETAKVKDKAITPEKIDLSNRYVCVLSKAGDQSTTNGVVAPITFTSEVYDPRGWHDNSTNTSRVTPNVAGIYRVNGQATFADSSAGTYRFVGIGLNGTDLVVTKYAKDADGRAGGSVFANVELNGTTDYIELRVQQNAGTINARLCHLTVELIGTV